MAEHAVCDEQYLALKPKSLSFEDAAALPLAAMTALHALRKYNGPLEGKTVFVPAGLSGTGSYACQLAKNVFKAGKVITTVSTSKVPRVPELLGEGVVDQVIDYTKQSPHSVIPTGTVDFCFDTTGQSMSFLSLMVPTTSLIVSIATTPSGVQLSGADLMRRPDRPQLPWLAGRTLNAMDAVRKLRASRWGVEYTYLFLDTNGEDLGAISRYVNEGILQAVVGTRVELRDEAKVREACELVWQGKGGAGKAVMKVK